MPFYYLANSKYLRKIAESLINFIFTKQYFEKMKMEMQDQVEKVYMKAPDCGDLGLPEIYATKVIKGK